MVKQVFDLSITDKIHAISPVETVAVTCPSCFEIFEVTLPPAEECPCEVDYDCEVCCRPMLISFSDGFAEARSLDD